MPDFCDTYRARPDIDAVIAAGNEQFYVAYQNWEAAKAPDDKKSMCYLFGGMEEVVAKKLDDGDGASGKTNGGVRQEHCRKFKTFLTYDCTSLVYTEAQFADLGIDIRAGADQQLVNFKAAVGNYVLGKALSQDEYDLLNGALFVRVQIEPTNMDDSQAEQYIYAFPGQVVMKWRFSAFAPVWEIVDDKIEDALRKLNTSLINVNGAVQLRLGRDGLPYFRPIVIGEGMTTKGSKG